MATHYVHTVYALEKMTVALLVGVARFVAKNVVAMKPWETFFVSPYIFVPIASSQSWAKLYRVIFFLVAGEIVKVPRLLHLLQKCRF